MRAIQFKNYDRIRLLVLELIGRAVVLRYGEIFDNLQKLPTTRYKLEVYPQIVREVLTDLTEEKRVRIWRVDPQHPQQFSLTEAGLQELKEGTSDADALMDAILAIRKLFPSQQPAVRHP
ncbi:MAG: hypothetical protein WAP52_04350 [Candidatus Sungiibacteriota bacterium]